MNIDLTQADHVPLPPKISWGFGGLCAALMLAPLVLIAVAMGILHRFPFTRKRMMAIEGIL